MSRQHPSKTGETSDNSVTTGPFCLRLWYIGTRTDTTQQSGQTPDKEVEIKNITIYVSDYTKTDTT
jgi:hypothetical protein